LRQRIFEVTGVSDPRRLVGAGLVDDIDHPLVARYNDAALAKVLREMHIGPVVFPCWARAEIRFAEATRDGGYVGIQPLRHRLREAPEPRERSTHRFELQGFGQSTASEPFADLVGLEEALDLIVSTTTDVVARATAEEALALYRGR
jgi:hypothetical protein